MKKALGFWGCLAFVLFSLSCIQERKIIKKDDIVAKKGEYQEYLSGGLEIRIEDSLGGSYQIEITAENTKGEGKIRLVSNVNKNGSEIFWIFYFGKPDPRNALGRKYPLFPINLGEEKILIMADERARRGGI